MKKRAKLFQLILAVLSRYSQVQLCIVYGSFASGTATEKSDVDLAIACDSELSVEKRMEIALQLSSCLGCEVDLVDLNRLNGLLLSEILTHGKILIKKSDEIYAQFVKRHLYYQADFRPLFDRILKIRRERFIHG